MTTILQHDWSKPLELDTQVDLIFADPPYNIGVDYADDPTSDKMTKKGYQKFCARTMHHCMELLRPGGTLWWLCPPEYATWICPMIHEQMGDLLYDRPIIWYERFSQYQQKRLTCDYRLLFPIVNRDKSLVTFNADAIREESERQRMGDKRADPRGRVPGHVWQISRLQGNASTRVDWHPAQLPLPPLERIIQGWTNPGDVVLDAFAGSGSLGIACKIHDRQFIGVDRSAEYCQRLQARMNEA